MNTVRGSCCDIPGRIFEPVKGMPMLGHVRQPDPIHPFRLARSGQAPVIVEDGGNPARSEGPTQPRRGAATSRARGAIASTASDRLSRSRSGRSSEASPSPRRSRVDSAPSPRRESAAAPSAGPLVGRSGRS